jgi:hypothetical protein
VKLAGYYNQLNRYPGMVVPIVTEGEKLFGAFLTDNGIPTLTEIGEETPFTPIEWSYDFDQTRERLIAIRPQTVMAFDVAIQGILTKALLCASNLTADSMTRLSLAECSADGSTVLSELVTSVEQIRKEDKEIALRLFTEKRKRLLKESPDGRLKRRGVSLPARMHLWSATGYEETDFGPSWMQVNWHGSRNFSREDILRAVWTILRALRYSEDYIQNMFLRTLQRDGNLDNIAVEHVLAVRVGVHDADSGEKA